jgi:iron-sulfur cluster repair protein YtfE (RIC family)
MRFGSVSEYLSWDHDRLDGLLEDVVRLVHVPNLAEARAAFVWFRDGLARHIRIEEEILFPLFERKTRIAHGPTLVLKDEHVRIQEALARIDVALASPAAGPFEDALATLQSVLAPHNEKEEHVLYPMTDEALGEEERKQVTERLVAG